MDSLDDLGRGNAVSRRNARGSCRHVFVIGRSRRFHIGVVEHGSSELFAEASPLVGHKTEARVRTQLDNSDAAAVCDGNDIRSAESSATCFAKHLDVATRRGRDGGSDAAVANGGTAIVRSGDTLRGIAHDHHVSMTALYKANPQFDPRREDGVPQRDRGNGARRDPDLIKPGERIRIPPIAVAGGSHHTRSVPSGSGRGGHSTTVVVRPGDTLGGIARNRRLSMRELCRANPRFDKKGARDPDYIWPGDRIRIPHRPADGRGRARSGQATRGGNDPSKSPRQVTPPRPPVATPPPAILDKPATAGAADARRHDKQDKPRPLLRLGMGGDLSARISRASEGRLEPYFKVNFGGVFTVKVKYTPNGKRHWGGERPLTGGAGAGHPRTPSLRRAFGDMAPEKVSIDGGIVFGRKTELGLSFEARNWNPATWHLSQLTAYASKKDKYNLLVDSAQVKLGKVDLVALGRAVRAHSWSNVWTAIRDGELGISVENSVGHVGPETVAVSGTAKARFVALREVPRNAAKAWNAALDGAVSSPATPLGGAASFSGVAVGTVASLGGWDLADRTIGRHIHNPTLRQAIDAAGAATFGVAADAATKRAVTRLGPEAAIAFGKAGMALGRAVPILGKVSRVAARIPLGAAGRVLGKVARISGPAGVLLAGVADAVDAYREFQAGETAKGWRSIAKGGIRIAFTALGTALGTLAGPGPGNVIGAVAGGIVGDKVAGLLDEGQRREGGPIRA